MASKTTLKATLLPANTQIKDLKTGQVVRVTKGTVPISTANNKKVVKMKMTRSSANTPTNSKQSDNLPVKQLPNKREND